MDQYLRRKKPCTKTLVLLWTLSSKSSSHCKTPSFGESDEIWCFSSLGFLIGLSGPATNMWQEQNKNTDNLSVMQREGGGGATHTSLMLFPFSLVYPQDILLLIFF